MSRFRTRLLSVLPRPLAGHPLYLRFHPDDGSIVDALIEMAGRVPLLLEQRQQARNTAAQYQRQLRELGVTVEPPWSRRVA